MKTIHRSLRICLFFAFLLTSVGIKSQGLPTDGPLTVRPMLQQLGEQLLQGKQGSIVAIRPETGEIICLSTNSPSGFDVNLAIAKAYAPGSTFKVAQALTMLTEGVISTSVSSSTATIRKELVSFM